MNAVFSNRRQAGQKLAQRLTAYKNDTNAIVLALPCGGVPVAYEIAKNLNLPLDVCLVGKIGLPDSLEPIGVIVEDALIHNYSGYITNIDCNIQNYGVEQSEIQAVAAREKAELRWRESCYRHHRPLLAISHRTVIIVDDGMTTGLTMQAAVKALSTHQPAKIMVAVPVASGQAIAKLECLVDDLICLANPKALGAVGFWYEDFNHITDREVCNLLERQTCRQIAEFC